MLLIKLLGTLLLLAPACHARLSGEDIVCPECSSLEVRPQVGGLGCGTYDCERCQRHFTCLNQVSETEWECPNCNKSGKTTLDVDLGSLGCKRQDHKLCYDCIEDIAEKAKQEAEAAESSGAAN
ncbi:hypothetical protein O181_014195 [Austropuccinia psidii MF-1]|uniref:RING-type domain-containing protein n=1 Tax=Austropuccinia psidii MF-1 TaxID=1389203 RepID=A0A9Q3C1E8_9BASI|nr:hypothetical protein [Austropuccinia psidii MF-1]